MRLLTHEWLHALPGSAGWPTHQQRTHHQLLESAATQHVITPGTISGYRDATQALHRRNDALLDAAQAGADGAVLALWNGVTSGGTFGTIVKVRERVCA